MKKLYKRLDEATLRMDSVVLLAGMLNDGMAMADPLRELLEALRRHVGAGRGARR